MSALACFAAAAVAVIVVAVAGGSWLIAALDGPLWAISLVVAVGVGALLGLLRGLASGRDPSWREREGRRDGYVSDGDDPDMPRASQEWRDMFTQLDEGDQNRKAL